MSSDEEYMVLMGGALEVGLEVVDLDFVLDLKNG